MSTTGAPEKDTNIGSSPSLDNLGTLDPRGELREARILKRSPWGAALLTLVVSLCALNGILYAVRTVGPGDIGYAVGSCLIPFVCWFVYFRRHYFSKAPVSTDGWSTTLVIVGILASVAASKNLVIKSPKELVNEINTHQTPDSENEHNANARQTLTRVMELNKVASTINAEFEKSYGGKNFLQNGCFLSPDLSGTCLADTEKALDGFKGVIDQMKTVWRDEGITPTPLQVAQYQTMVTLFSDAAELYRYSANPSRQVSIDNKDGKIRIVGVQAFNLKLNKAIADQDSFRKATKAYVEYQNKGLGQMGLKPEDLGATHYNPSEFDRSAK